MKKFLFILIGLIVSFSGYSQKILDQNLNAFLCIKGETWSNSSWIQLNIDTNGKYYLKITHTFKFYGYSDDDVINFGINYFNLSITPLPEKNKNFFIKLSNDSIYQLYCIDYDIKYWHKEYNLSMRKYEYQYNVSSIIPINEKLINDLSIYKIIKLRVQHSTYTDYCEIVQPGDYTFNLVKTNCDKIYNNYLVNKQRKQEYINEQNKINENPLYNF